MFGDENMNGKETLGINREVKATLIKMKSGPDELGAEVWNKGGRIE